MDGAEEDKKRGRHRKGGNDLSSQEMQIGTVRKQAGWKGGFLMAQVGWRVHCSGVKG